jgi:hypothetical protein
MYKIYADGQLLHAPHLIHEGCGVISPKLTKELNKAGSLDFVIPPNHMLYNDINKLKTIITVHSDNKEIFRGRVLNDEKDFYKQKKTYVEGELAFLLDARVRPYSFSGPPAELFTKYINWHNPRVEPDKRFIVGNITVKPKDNAVTCENYNYPDTLSEIEEQLLNVCGGYLQTRVVGTTRYIDWLADDTGTKNPQIIEFGINLLDITEHITAENIFTVIIPLGATVEDKEGNSTKYKLTISADNGGKDYIENTKAVSLFGWIEHSEEWSDVENVGILKNLGRDLLEKNIELATTITLKAVDLSLLNVDYETICVGDLVRVISIPHEINREFQCSKIVYDLEKPEQTEYTFGAAVRTLTEQQVSDKKFVSNTINKVSQSGGTIIVQKPTVTIDDNNILIIG